MSMLTGLLVLLISAVGHAEWWVVFVNRIHALPIHHRKLRVSRKAHDAAIILYPLLLVAVAGFGIIGFGSKGLLAGGTFSDLPAWQRFVILVTSSGCVPFVWGVIRWQVIQKHQFRYTTNSETVDLAALAASGQMDGDVRGPRPHLSAGLPFNEFLKLEKNVKSIRIMDVPDQTSHGTPVASSGRGGPGSHMLRAVHFSDLHFVGCPGEGYYRWLVAQAASMKPDVFFFTGDLIDDPALIGMATEILKPLTEVAPCCFVLGNHDWRYDHEALRRCLEQSGWVSAAGRSFVQKLGSARILIAGSELPWIGTAPPMPGSDSGDVESAYDLAVLLSHSPDEIRFAQQARFDVMLAGHTHGGQVVLPIIGPVYSPSRFGVRYASGLFAEGAVALHVSRGIGGKDPLRWRCRPELTLLEIDFPGQRRTD